MNMVPAESSFAFGVTLLFIICLPLMLAVVGLLPRLRKFAMALAPWSPLPALGVALWSHPGPSLEMPWFLLGMRMGLDEIGRIFLMVTAILWMMAGVFARASMVEDLKPHWFFFFYLVTMSGSLGLSLVQDLATFILCSSLMTFAAYGLIIHRNNPAAQRAGRIYLILAVVGEAMLLEAIMLITVATGSQDLPLDPVVVAAAPTRDLIILLLLAGFGIKIGMVPLHLWIPLAYPSSPAPASAALSGTMVMAGSLGLLRHLPVGEMPLPDWGMFCMAAGVIATFYGVGVGVTQKDPKAILAYSVISQAGLIIMGIGVSMVAPKVWPLALPALLLYSMHNALVLGALFLGVDVAYTATSTVRHRRLVAAGLLLSALWLAGAPLSSGTAAKTMLQAAAAMTPWAEQLSWFLALAAIGTTLLMGRFLVEAWPRVQDEGAKNGARLTTGIWLPWAILLLCVGMFAWVVRLGPPFKPLSLFWSPTAVWGSLWPIMVGGLLVWVVEKKPRLLMALSIPPGDIVLWVELLVLCAQGKWRSNTKMWWPKWSKGEVSYWFLRQRESWFASILGKAEGRMRDWMALGVMFLSLAAMFFALLITTS